MKLLFPYSAAQARDIIAKSAYEAPAPSNTQGVVVSAIQYCLKPLPNLDAYVEDVEARYRLAASHGARLIVFPELFGLTPLSCAAATRRQFREKSGVAAEEGRADASPCEPAALRVSERPDAFFSRLVRALFPLIGGAVEVADAMLSALSKKYGILTASGSAPERIDGRLYNVQTLYGADGAVIGRQKKVNPMENELQLGVCYAEELSVFDTEIGRIAIPVCMDASYPENFRILYEKGADIVALGTFNLEEYDFYWALRGLRPRCSDYPLYGVKSAMTGWAAGMKATGRAEIDAPSDTVMGGVLAESDMPLGDSLVSAEIDPGRPFARDTYRADFDAPQLRRLLTDLY